ncbi:type IV secretory system conjugative DNA transfer family protein [Sphingomonas sp. 3-13AW]|uniref:type IV secretory system conjugative DNA transfer family protein n=1 Tax=Sphingomonas sp. 3-13AW TaxID=3050450 RepID=UPI003BB7961B
MRSKKPYLERRHAMTHNKSRMIADAKRAARRLARTRAETYQECLDIVARRAGRAHWGAFLADPADVRSGGEPATQLDAMPGSALIQQGAGDPRAGPRGDRAPIIAGSSPPVRSEPSGEDRILNVRGGEGIVLGVADERLVRSSRQAAVLCVGEPAVGKTMSIVLPTIALSPDASQIIHDPKLEILRATLSLDARTESRILVLDISAQAPLQGGETIAFNPLHPDFAVDEDVWGHALRVARVLVPLGGRGTPYFQERARLLLAALCSYLMLHPHRIPTDGYRTRIASLPAVVDWLSSVLRSGLDDALMLVVEDCLASGAPAQIASEVTPLIRMAPRERSGILGTVDQALIIAKCSLVRKVLDPVMPDDGASIIRAFADRDQATTAFIYPQQNLGAGPLAALALDLVARWRSEKGPSARSLQIIIDEAAKLPPIPEIERILSDGAPPGTALLIVDQRLPLAHPRRWWGKDPECCPRFDQVVSMIRGVTTQDAGEIAELAGMQERSSLEPQHLNASFAHHVVVDAGGPRPLATPHVFPEHTGESE